MTKSLLSDFSPSEKSCCARTQHSSTLKSLNRKVAPPHETHAYTSNNCRRLRPAEAEAAATGHRLS